MRFDERPHRLIARILSYRLEDSFGLGPLRCLVCRIRFSQVASVLMSLNSFWNTLSERASYTCTEKGTSDRIYMPIDQNRCPSTGVALSSDAETGVLILSLPREARVAAVLDGQAGVALAANDNRAASDFCEFKEPHNLQESRFAFLGSAADLMTHAFSEIVPRPAERSEKIHVIGVGFRQGGGDVRCASGAGDFSDRFRVIRELGNNTASKGAIGERCHRLSSFVFRSHTAERLEPRWPPFSCVSAYIMRSGVFNVNS